MTETTRRRDSLSLDLRGRGNSQPPTETDNADCTTAVFVPDFLSPEYKKTRHGHRRCFSEPDVLIKDKKNAGDQSQGAAIDLHNFQLQRKGPASSTSLAPKDAHTDVLENLAAQLSPTTLPPAPAWSEAIGGVGLDAAAAGGATRLPAADLARRILGVAGEVVLSHEKPTLHRTWEDLGEGGLGGGGLEPSDFSFEGSGPSPPASLPTSPSEEVAIATAAGFPAALGLSVDTTRGRGGRIGGGGSGGSGGSPTLWAAAADSPSGLGGLGRGMGALGLNSPGTPSPGAAAAAAGQQPPPGGGAFRLTSPGGGGGSPTLRIGTREMTPSPRGAAAAAAAAGVAARGGRASRRGSLEGSDGGGSARKERNTPPLHPGRKSLPAKKNKQGIAGSPRGGGDKAAASPAARDRRGNYRCGRCGQPKVNHVCQFVVDGAARSVGTATDTALTLNDRSAAALDAVRTAPVRPRVWAGAEGGGGGARRPFLHAPGVDRDAVGPAPLRVLTSRGAFVSADTKDGSAGESQSATPQPSEPATDRDTSGLESAKAALFPGGFMTGSAQLQQLAQACGGAGFDWREGPSMQAEPAAAAATRGMLPHQQQMMMMIQFQNFQARFQEMQQQQQQLLQFQMQQMQKQQQQQMAGTSSSCAGGVGATLNGSWPSFSKGLSPKSAAKQQIQNPGSATSEDRQLCPVPMTTAVFGDDENN